jgi:uncharacterized membrane protein (UPF0182 family)
MNHVFFISVVIFLLGLVPLIITGVKARQYESEEHRRQFRSSVMAFAAIILFLIAYNILFTLYSELLWFKNLGFEARFWTVFRSKALLYAAEAAVSFIFLFFNSRMVLKNRGIEKSGLAAFVTALIPSLLLGIWTLRFWEKTLLFLNRAPTEFADPVFGRSIGFYLFSLPFHSSLTGWFIFLFILGLIVVGVCNLIGTKSTSVNPVDEEKRRGSLVRQVLFLISVTLLALTWNSYLAIFKLMYSSWGAVRGPGYVDVHLRLYGYYLSIAIFFAAAVILLIGIPSSRLREKLLGLHGKVTQPFSGLSGRTATLPLLVIGGLILVNWIVPAIVTGVVVKPNEITLERPYLKHNISFTRKAYAIDSENIESKQYEVKQDVTREVTDLNRSTLNNIRLWDWRALIDNLKQQQEIRLYYQFNDVDIDRYHLDGDYTEVMLAVRELEKDELAAPSKTWVSNHLKYTNGYGLVLTPVHRFLPQGRPDLLIKNIPPQIDVRSLSLQRPEIYYGEKTTDHVYVLTTEEEFNYPSGERNAYSNYEGTGGVALDSLLKKIIYAWKFDGHRLLFSTYFNRESRVMFHRSIVERVRTLAPFLTFDRDPYAVITDDGRIVYIVDAYTTSSNYPYSENYTGYLRYLRGINYIRNAVKVVVDAYNGSVTFYIVDEDDPLIRAYRRIFPTLLSPFSEMPEDIRRHIRYPVDLLTVKAELFNTYHMEDVQAFYQREDVWQFATERYREKFQAVIPYYVMIKFPGSEDVEFVLMMPLTPKNKNVINAWIAGRCDYPHYGKIIVYTFPKGVEVLGPRQIEARIDQDTEMSRSMTLWGQRGSQVIRGNLLAIPLFKEDAFYLLYAEPVFLQAEDAQLPELKRIVLADQGEMVWAETFEGALRRLVGGRPERTKVEGPERGPVQPLNEYVQSTIARANELMEQYQRAASSGNFAEAGRRLEELSDILDALESAGEE